MSIVLVLQPAVNFYLRYFIQLLCYKPFNFELNICGPLYYGGCLESLGSLADESCLSFMRIISSKGQVVGGSGALKIASLSPRKSIHHFRWCSSNDLERKNFGMSSFSLLTSIFSSDGGTQLGTPRGTLFAYCKTLKNTFYQ